MTTSKKVRKSMCWDKIYYRSVYDATENIKKLRLESEKYNHPYKIYACPYCKGYHLSQRIDATYRFLSDGEDITLHDTICVLQGEKIVHRLKVNRVNIRYVFTRDQRYLRIYTNNARYKVEREVKQDIQVKKELT